MLIDIAINDGSHFKPDAGSCQWQVQLQYTTKNRSAGICNPVI